MAGPTARRSHRVGRLVRSRSDAAPSRSVFWISAQASGGGDDHGRPLSLTEIRPGDAVAYEANAGGAQFWAVPTRR